MIVPSWRCVPNVMYTMKLLLSSKTTWAAESAAWTAEASAAELVESAATVAVTVPTAHGHSTAIAVTSAYSGEIGEASAKISGRPDVRHDIQAEHSKNYSKKDQIFHDDYLTIVKI